MPNVLKEVDLYKRMIEEIQDYAIIMLDENGYIQNWNKGAQKIKGYSEDEILGAHFSLFYLPEDRERNLPQQLLNKAKMRSVPFMKAGASAKTAADFGAMSPLPRSVMKMVGLSDSAR